MNVVDVENKEITDILPDRKVETIEKYLRSCDTSKPVLVSKIFNVRRTTYYGNKRLKRLSFEIVHSRGNMRDSCGKTGDRDPTAVFARRLGRSSAESEYISLCGLAIALLYGKRAFNKDEW